MSSGSAATATWALIQKEFVLILRNKHLLFLLLFPTTVQLLLLGFALNPGIHDEKVVVFDESNTSASRALIAVLNNTGMFETVSLPPGQTDIVRIFADGAAKAVLTIPHEFQADLERFHSANAQFILDGTDAYSASLTRGLLAETVLNSQVRGISKSAVKVNTHILFNPGLFSAWYFVPGLLGGLLTLSATLVSSAVMLRERESGTLEHLLMLPVTAAEMFVAKVLPIFCLLLIDLLIALVLSQLVFRLPIRGSLFLFLAMSSVYLIVAIGIGVLLGTFCKTQKQAKLLSFFINIPLLLFSGIVVPLNTMPTGIRWLSTIDPLQFYQESAKDILLKGAGPGDLTTEIIGLTISALIIVGISIWRFRDRTS